MRKITDYTAIWSVRVGPFNWQITVKLQDFNLRMYVARCWNRCQVAKITHAAVFCLHKCLRRLHPQPRPIDSAIRFVEGSLPEVWMGLITQTLSSYNDLRMFHWLSQPSVRGLISAWCLCRSRFLISVGRSRSYAGGWSIFEFFFCIFL